ncbi:P-loop containing nucleoside triphosphate hydrolase protein [Hygrophoropsis aurantiaca]|uniref:P-loop containing nucleoside triphosphate hydrolase protein n=1 Tax=Hygrophoropsis aurantiaca TaxID=72124 RepID=A0ACB8ARU7_9AGAM|nr:P-loop containing nucleoside triphosphate hydrolase protein [Hygrophoropsis aurantiaca]
MNRSWLDALNKEQSDCVQHSPNGPLQILAGPGSGKTKVLTSRIAFLIMHHGLSPSSICAVTFTNKAANEMRARLVKLIGKDRTAQVRMGTFHSICALFLRKHATSVGLDGNFTICDADESKKLISNLLKSHKDFLTSKDISLKEGTVLSMISKAKAKGQGPDDLIPQKLHAAKTAQRTMSPIQDDIQRIVAEIYKCYEKTLRQSNSLDFDDLLVFGVKLFSQHPGLARWCHHVLVDEFQDTNTTQYELMRCIAAANQCVTVVGDPDQSIYGWRSAEIANLAKMRNDFANVSQIFLEQNYRSTGSILAASIAMISQDKSRIPKTLRTTHSLGPRPVLRPFPSEHDEASFIAYEIKRLVAQTGGMLTYGDFVVLLRYNAISRSIESALQKERIPNRILGGHKFFERAEIKDLLAYLQLVDNPQFEPAFSRAINIPSRGIGEKSLAEILSRATKLNISPLAVIERICDSKIPDLKVSVKRKASPFIAIVRTLKKLAAKRTSPADLITHLLKLTDYEDHLKRTQPDWDTRWENVQELINFASETTAGPVSMSDPGASQDSLSGSDNDETPLRLFLQSSMLSSEGDTSNADDNEKVTLATCHAAKGLEWPVVIIPAVEGGTFPFYRTDDIDEERRLLYVACTRAQALLYLTHSSKRKFAGDAKRKDLSEFVSAVLQTDQSLFADNPHHLAPSDRQLIATILGREELLPDQTEVDRRMALFKHENRLSPLYCELVDSASQAIGSHPTPRSESEINGNPYMPVFRSSKKFFHVENTSLVSSHHKPASVVLKDIKNPEIAAAAVSAKASRISIAPYANKMNCESTTIKQTILLPHLPLQTNGVAPNSSHSLMHEPSSRNDPLQTSSVTSISPQNPTAPLPIAGSKRRLGMGRTTTGYSNKKFKTPA